MLFAVNVPRRLITTNIKMDDDVFNPTKGLTIKIQYTFKKELLDWFEEHLTEVPKINVQYSDFETTSYYIFIPTHELKTQFEITWY